MTATVDSEDINKMSEKKKEITYEQSLVAETSIATAQKHQGGALSADSTSAVTKGEEHLIEGNRLKGEPTSAAQSILVKSNDTLKEANQNNPAYTTVNSAWPKAKGLDTLGNYDACSGKIDSVAISAILAAEKKITNQKVPVKGGPTAQAQKHSGEDINSQAMHDVTEGEKLITGQKTVVKGGPTAILQHNMSKCKLSDDKTHQSVAQNCCGNGQDKTNST